MRSKKFTYLMITFLIATVFLSVTFVTPTKVSANQIDMTGIQSNKLIVYAKNTTTIVHVMDNKILTKVKAPGHNSQMSSTSKTISASKSDGVKGKASSKQTPTSSTPAVSRTTTNSSVTPAKVKRERNNYVNGQLGRPPLTTSDERKQTTDGKIVNQSVKNLPSLSTVMSSVIIIIVFTIVGMGARKIRLFS